MHTHVNDYINDTHSLLYDCKYVLPIITALLVVYIANT